MKINIPKDKFVFIELTKKDMEKMGITCESMDYSDPVTKAAIDSLIDEAGRSLGYSFGSPDKIKVDALPSLNGGCLLFFTAVNKPTRYKVKSRETNLCFEFEKYEHVFDLADTIPTGAINRTKSSLYDYNGRIILFVSGRMKHSLVARINEYADPLKPDSHTCSLIKEYGVCLGKGNALKMFSGRGSQ